MTEKRLELPQGTLDLLILKAVAFEPMHGWANSERLQQISEDAIRRAIDNDPETEVKKKAVFALTQMKNGDGVPLLIEIARTNRNAVVKKEAMVQLGRSKDPRAVKFFEDLLAAR